MPIGKVLSYNSEKGYGFITHGNNEKDVFFHASELAKAGIKISDNISLTGLMLEYEIGLGKNNKKQAMKIKLVSNGKARDNSFSQEAINKTTV